jgi:hypothetical protein
LRHAAKTKTRIQERDEGMNMSSFAVGIIAQAMASAAAPEAAVPWWREAWALWGIALLTLAVPTFVARLIAGALRASDMWGRIATVLIALTAGVVICRLGWPPRLGIDLKGGLILVYEVDNSKQSAARVDDAIRRVEGMLKSQDGSQGTVRRRQGGGMTVRLATADARAREAFIAVRAEYTEAIKRLEAVITNAEREGIIAPRCSVPVAN